MKPIENAGQINAYMTLNIRGRRSKTDSADNNSKYADALEVAGAQDAYFAHTGKFVGPLHGIPIAIKDNCDTVDIRTTAGAGADYADDKPAKDATIVAKLRAAGAIILGKINLDGAPRVLWPSSPNSRRYQLLPAGILGLTPPLVRSDDVRWRGETLLGLRPHAIPARHIAIVPHGRRLFASLTSGTLTLA